MTYIRHTPDNVIEPLLRIPDEEIYALWKPTVPYEFRPGKKTEYMGGFHFTEEMRQGCSDRGIKRRREKQRAYASECTPKEDGDETILRLYGDGMKAADVARQVGLKFGDVRGRLIACHPEGKTLR